MSTLSNSKLRILALVILLPIGALVIVGSGLGIARFRREQRELKEFKLVKSVASPSGTKFALHFEHIPEKGLMSQQIVVIDSQPKISIPNLWTRMKAEQEILLENGSDSGRIGLVWKNESSLLLKCSECSETSTEMLRRASSAGPISIEYIGFSKDAPYTKVHPAEITNGK